MTTTTRNRCSNLRPYNTVNHNSKIILCLIYGFWFRALIFYNLTSEASSIADNPQRTWRLITRTEWKARTPKSIQNFTGPSEYVILHHSYEPGVCYSEDACKASMRSMQNFHMDTQGWVDIGYSFAIGGDGNVYEARGYNKVGAHAPNYNRNSIGLLLIGNFISELPPAPMLRVAQDFIKYSVEIGELRKDYILYGHRQVRNTECPGQALYTEITKWPHWSAVEDVTSKAHHAFQQSSVIFITVLYILTALSI